ncbi:MAG: AI-2E family transporter [Planctomycetaceae bacterium]|nr:AI-2E family transporter [Planctomycetaceae bacterium]
MARSRESMIRSPLPTILVAALAIAALHFARQILLPVALAGLLSFLLTPLVSRLERLGIGRVASVVFTVLGVFVLISILGWVLLNQVAVLSNNLPEYRRNLIAKVRSVRQAGTKLEEVKKTIEEVGMEFTDEAEGTEKEAVNPDESGQSHRTEASPPSSSVANRPNRTEEDDAAKVKVVEMPPSPLTQLDDWLGPLVAPLTSGGIVVVLVIFILIVKMLALLHLNNLLELLADAAVPRACFHGVDHVVPEFAA